jgi:hypothetical protein
MKELFLTYKQALALKKFGFDEPCLAYYTNHPHFINDQIESQEGNDKVCSAPLKSQALKWFRDKGFDFATVEKYKEKGKFYGGYINKPGERFGNSFGSNFKTYEESESACIDRLIEIIKGEKL